MVHTAKGLPCLWHIQVCCILKFVVHTAVPRHPPCCRAVCCILKFVVRTAKRNGDKLSPVVCCIQKNVVHTAESKVNMSLNSVYIIQKKYGYNKKDRSLCMRERKGLA